MIYSGHLTVDQEERLLRWAWEAWRFAVGPPIRTKYPEFVKILNIGAHNNGKLVNYFYLLTQSYLI